MNVLIINQFTGRFCVILPGSQRAHGGEYWRSEQRWKVSDHPAEVLHRCWSSIPGVFLLLARWCSSSFDAGLSKTCTTCLLGSDIELPALDLCPLMLIFPRRPGWWDQFLLRNLLQVINTVSAAVVSPLCGYSQGFYSENQLHNSQLRQSFSRDLSGGKKERNPATFRRASKLSLAHSASVERWHFHVIPNNI